MTESTKKDGQPTVAAVQNSGRDGADNTTDKTHNEPPASVQSGKVPGRGLGLFAVLLSLVALAGTGFTWYQTQVSRVQQESSLAVGVTEIGGQVSRLGDAIARVQQQQADIVTGDQLDNRFTQLTLETEASLTAMAEQQTALTESISLISEDLKKGVREYVLDEVAQLLRLANNNALLVGDAHAAIQALSLADSQLKGLRDPRYAVVRTKINEEIALLRAVETADVEALSATLSTLAAGVPDLPLANEPPSSPMVFAEQAAEAEVSWRTELGKVWRDIMNSIQIQRVDRPPKPLLAPEQRYFLNQNLQMELNQAELALLQQRPAVFSRSLQQAVTWLEEYFDTEDERVSEMVRQLTDIQAQEIDVALPAITGSFDLLQQLKSE